MPRTSPVVAFARRHRRGLTTVLSIVALFLLANYVVLPVYVNHGSRLEVPRVVGLPLDAARAVLDSCGLQSVDAGTRPDPTYPAGAVVFQNPLPGAIVKEGRRVYLTISGGEPLVSVPLLRGKSLRDARFALERNGLKLGEAAYEYSETFPENTIIDQSRLADSRVSRGSSVRVTVSRGRELAQFPVPAVVGKTLAEAGKILAAAGLRPGIVTYQPSFDLLPNTVVDQFPRAGDPVSPGQEIDLFVVSLAKPTDEIQPPPQ